MCVENPREETWHMTLKTCTLFPALMSIVPFTCHDRPYTEPERLLPILVILSHTHNHTHMRPRRVSFNFSVRRTETV
jgi:hypothetical protein